MFGAQISVLLWKTPAPLVLIGVVSRVSFTCSASDARAERRAAVDVMNSNGLQMRSRNVCPLRLPVDRRCHVGPLHGELPFKFPLITTFTGGIKNISLALFKWQVKACCTVVRPQLAG